MPGHSRNPALDKALLQVGFYKRAMCVQIPFGHELTRDLATSSAPKASLSKNVGFLARTLGSLQIPRTGANPNSGH